MTAQQANLILQDNKLIVSGKLDFSNVDAVYQQSLSYFHQLANKDAHVVMIDFSAVTTTNSASLALVFEWLKIGKQLNQIIQFSHLSTKLMEIAKAAGVEDFLE